MHRSRFSPPPHPDSSEPAPGPDDSFPRTNRYPELTDLAREQAGVLSYVQLHALGWSRHRIESEIALDRWTQVAPRVVALQNSPLGRIQQLWLGVLHAGPSSRLSHASACQQAGLRFLLDDPMVHVLTAKSDEVSPLPGFWFHQSRRPFDRWIHPGGGVPRLRIEHAALLTAERDNRVRRAVGLLAACVQQRLTTAERLLVASAEIRKLRHGALFRASLGDIAGGAHSFAEIDIGRLCREAGLRSPDRQRVRLDKQGRRRYLDCEWVLEDGSIVVLEIDGSFHMRTDHWWRDMGRERAVVISGRRVLRCSSVELRTDPAAIIEDLRAIGVPPATPHHGFVRASSA
jgi:hypothetical protein